MKSYKNTTPEETTLKINNSFVGESLEEKVNRIVNNKEPIRDGAPMIYTDRANGVIPNFNIRTDRFDLAVEAMDKLSMEHIAKRTSPERVEGKENTETGQNGSTTDMTAKE
jgi:hypothetical protein